MSKLLLLSLIKVVVLIRGLEKYPGNRLPYGRGSVCIGNALLYKSLLSCSPNDTCGLHSCQIRYPNASDKWVRFESRSLSITLLSGLNVTSSKSVIKPLQRGSTNKLVSSRAENNLAFRRAIRTRTLGLLAGTRNFG